MKKDFKILIKYIPAIIFAIVIIFAIATIPAIISAVNEHTHIYGEWEITKNPTCSEQGIEKRFCDCGDVQQNPIERLPHTEGEWTFNEEGTEKRLLCAVCNRTLQTESLTNHTHSFSEWTVEIEATCTKGGIMIRYCRCGWSDQKAVKPIDHKYGNWETVELPTCEENGIEKRTCQCGHSEERATHSLGGHKYGAWTVYLESTCSKEGIERRYCINDPSHYEDRTLSKKEHTYDEWKIVLLPTFDTDGKEESTCTKCYDKLTKSINKLCSDDWTISNSELLEVNKDIAGRVIIPSVVKTIAKEAFEKCEQITTVVITSNITHIGKRAFSYCDNLTTLIISKNIEKIDKFILDQSFSFSTIIFEGSKEAWINLMEKDGLNWQIGADNYTVYCANNEIISVIDGIPQ